VTQVKESCHLKAKYLFLWISFVLLFWTYGCGYRFAGGGSLPAGVKKVFVSILENRTSETGLENTLTQSLIYEFTRNKTSASKERSDAVFSGIIKSMKTGSISRTSGQTTVERRVILTLDLQLSRKDGRILWARNGISESEAYDVSENKLTTERNLREALSKLSERLAERIYNQLTEDF
jgi:Lipopolysaccharide-assembly